MTLQSIQGTPTTQQRKKKKKKQKTQITQFKNGQMTWEDIYPKKTYKRVTGVWKGHQHNKLSRKLKSKPQQNILSYLSRWLLLKNPQKVTCIDKGVKKS